MQMREIIEASLRKERGTVYISRNDNMDHWQGYFPGFARNDFKRVPVMVTILDRSNPDDPEAYYQYGVVRLKGVRLQVRRSTPGDDWEIDRRQNRFGQPI